MREMIDRVAKAVVPHLYGAHELPLPHELANVHKIARAAIEAMQEPTEASTEPPLGGSH